MHSFTDHYQDCLADIQSLVRIPSVKDFNSKTTPFGKNIDDALSFVLSKASSFGFRTWDINRKVGIVEFGEGEELLGIFVHIDVVPPGRIENWKYHPFEGIIHDDRIWGRGTLDDKGPTIAILYSMKRLKDLGYVPSKRVRLIIGTDEESTWECMKEYKAVEEEPTIGFTPDGCFPVTHSEKGIIYVQLTFPKVLATDLVSIDAGTAINVIPHDAQARLKKSSTPLSIDKIQGKYSDEEQHTLIQSKTSNKMDALPSLVHDLHKLLPPGDGMRKVLTEIKETILDSSGENLSLHFSDDISGKLSLHPTMMTFENNQLQCTLNIRYPSSLDADFLAEKLREAFRDFDANHQVIEHKKPVYFSEKSDFIQNFLSIYRDIMNDDSDPVSISGGTYARAFPNTVAFGALFPNEPLNAHQIDESVSLTAVYDWLRVYEEAIKLLSK
ncbi:Sapep family Mn(2+)-dependent dipeptidase [Evansella sp. AB-rgal1]|uniref:Sapep family Mn(2+)-dependent dipeptidase n=1 Tax=Evansella sp. AB-rgal1 TaxID=3242696 RepID=UPI00359CF6A7